MVIPKSCEALQKGTLGILKLIRSYVLSYVLHVCLHKKRLGPVQSVGLQLRAQSLITVITHMHKHVYAQDNRPKA